MRFIRYWLPSFIWMAVIFAFSAKQNVKIAPTQEENFFIFKTLHMLEYAWLYILNYRALSNTTKAKKPAVRLMAFLLTIAYASTDEFHQLFIPSREGRLRDVIIDAAGAIFAWISLKYLLLKPPPKLRNLLSDWQLT